MKPPRVVSGPPRTPKLLLLRSVVRQFRCKGSSPQAFLCSSPVPSNCSRLPWSTSHVRKATHFRSQRASKATPLKSFAVQPQNWSPSSDRETLSPFRRARVRKAPPKKHLMPLSLGGIFLGFVVSSSPTEGVDWRSACHSSAYAFGYPVHFWKLLLPPFQASCRWPWCQDRTCSAPAVPSEEKSPRRKQVCASCRPQSSKIAGVEP